ncbi:MAG: hypothetical protein JO141_07975 [Bradyrhizobium sp.]|nr:hypothetical protein [Bradyrhizobium sp.]
MAMRSASPFTRAIIAFMCPLAFAVTGLLLDGAVLVWGDDHLTPAWRFTLVAGAPALAAIAAIKVAADDPLDLGSGNHFGRR